MQIALIIAIIFALGFGILSLFQQMALKDTRKELKNTQSDLLQLNKHLRNAEQKYLELTQEGEFTLEDVAVSLDIANAKDYPTSQIEFMCQVREAMSHPDFPGEEFDEVTFKKLIVNLPSNQQRPYPHIVMPMSSLKVDDLSLWKIGLDRYQRIWKEVFDAEFNPDIQHIFHSIESAFMQRTQGRELRKIS